MPMSPLVLCNNILRRGYEDGVSISPMKLQKLLYYVSVEYSKATGQKLFSEDFYVWKYGPVMPVVYNYFKPYSGKEIKEYSKDASGNASAYDESSSAVLRRVLDRVWHDLGRLSAVAVSEMTHKSDSGWCKAYFDSRDTITLEDMKADMSYVREL